MEHALVDRRLNKTEEDLMDDLTDQVMDKLYDMSEEEFIALAAKLLDLDTDRIKEALLNARLQRKSF